MTVRHPGCISLLLLCTALHSRDTTSYYLNHPSVRAFLDVIAYAEGTYGPDGYRMHFGGDLFDSFEDHPRVVIAAPSRGRQLCSSAAGRYHFLERTWDDLASSIDARDFSPKNQDRAALEVIRTKGALGDILNNKPERALIKLNRMWASFPGSPYGQPTKKIQDLTAFYRNRLAYYRRILR